MTSDILDDIKKEILSKLPDEIQVSKVEFEGPEVVVYTKNPPVQLVDFSSKQNYPLSA